MIDLKGSTRTRYRKHWLAVMVVKRDVVRQHVTRTWLERISLYLLNRGHGKQDVRYALVPLVS